MIYKNHPPHITGTSDAINEEVYLDWRPTLLFFLTHALEFSSILHVALLVFLRLMTLRNPLPQGECVIKLRRYSILTIWIISIVLNIIPFLSWVSKLKDVSEYFALVNLHCFGTIPVIGIIIMYGLLVWTVRKKQRQDQNLFLGKDDSTVEANNRRTTALISRVVMVLIICYVPYLGEQHYYYHIMVERASRKLTFEVKLTSAKYYFLQIFFKGSQ